jgi:serine/threonine protein phosphatase PrpC
LKISNKHH